jgi:riboflavin kinase/FMN adenylyltransferase
MNVFDGIESFAPPDGGTVLTVGNFDGVHRGHQRIIRTAIEIAEGRPGSQPVAMTFEPHPREILAPRHAPPRLTTRADKLALLQRSGVAATIVLRSEPALFQRSALEFLTDVTRRCRPVAMVEGASFSFGRGREGSVEMLRRCGEELGYSLTVVDTMLCDELPGRPGVSSSAVRDAVGRGDVETAAVMLGRAYSISGTVGGGAGRGAKIGFPTANLDDIPQMVPGFGVYAGAAELAGGSRRPAAINIGPQPTFGGEAARVEAHLLDFSGDLRGASLRLHFARRLRGQVKFESVGALRAQLAADVHAVRGAPM